MKHIERPLHRKRGLLKPLSIAVAVTALVTGYAASAATGDMTQTWTSSSTTPTSTIFGIANTPSWGWPNLPVPSNGSQAGTITSAQGNYRVNLNFWNQDITQGNVTTSTMTINVDDQSGLYFIKPTTSSGAGFFKANSYYPGSRPQDNKACAAGAFNSQDDCHWAPNKANPSGKPIHAPGSYPSIYNGCHYNQCTKSGTWKDGTAKDGAPYPLQVNQITSIPSHWVVDTSQAASTAVYDVGYDIWFDKNPNRDSSGNIVSTGGTPSLPGNPHNVNQNNGLEIMIWINNKGYTQGGTANGGIIQPAGNLRASAVQIAGVTGTWDVWITDTAKSGTAPNDWYVVSYVKVPDSGTGGSGGGTDDFQFDSKYFMNDAANRQCIGEKCLSPTWWLTSIQAGFEVWADGETLTTKSFTADPTWLPSAIQGGRLWKNPDGTNVSDPTHNGGKPISIVFWGAPFNVSAVCPNPSASDSGSWTFNGTDPTTGQAYMSSGSLTRDALGVLVGTVTAPYPAHEWATLTITTVCGGVSTSTTTDFWIDPAGTVKDTTGRPLVGVPVTLYRSATATGTFTAVPNGDTTIMSDKNRKNPSDTGLYGDFSWDVSPGFYKVRATAPGCHAPGNPSQAFVESAVYQVPPPALGISLVMECDNAGGSNGVSVKLTVNGTDWQNGYCRNVVLTNTTSKAVTWKVTFPLPFVGNVTQAWNMNYTKSGNNLTAWGVGWNNVIQPGQTLKDQGFCATK